VVAAGAPCLESRSNHGRVEGPNSAEAAEGIGTAEDQLVEHTPQLRMTVLAGAREEAHSLTLKLKHRSPAAVVLAVLDTSQSVDQVKHSMGCLFGGAAVVVG
jgi:hypothetical protein